MIAAINATFTNSNLDSQTDYTISIDDSKLSDIQKALTSQNHNVELTNVVTAKSGRTIGSITKLIVNNSPENAKTEIPKKSDDNPYIFNFNKLSLPTLKINTTDTKVWNNEYLRAYIEKYLIKEIDKAFKQQFPNKTITSQTDYAFNIQETQLSAIFSALNSKDHDVELTNVVTAKSGRTIGSITKLIVNNSPENKNSQDETVDPDSPSKKPSTSSGNLSSSSTAFISTLSVISILILGTFSFMMFHRIRSYGGIKNMLHLDKKKHEASQSTEIKMSEKQEEKAEKTTDEEKIEEENNI